LRILFIGDVVGKTGRTIILDRLPGLVRDWKLDLVVINGENAAGGFGITESIYNDLIDAGAAAARAILERRRGDLDAGTELLIVKETLTAEEFAPLQVARKAAPDAA